MARSSFVVVLAVASFSQFGCVGAPGGEEESLGTAKQELPAENGLSTNGLSTNGLSTNGLSTNGLSTNGLSTNGLSTNGLVMTQLTDPESRKILAYVTSCALPLGESFDLPIGGDVYTFSGELGLAPGWGGDTGSCDAECQAWVSGCIVSRLNYNGDTIPISLRGSAEVLASSDEERAEFPAMEAAYFGDLFSNPPRLFACTAHGSTLIERVCGPAPWDTCPVTVLGDCDDYFELGSTLAPRCGIPDTTEGNYPDCRDDDGNTYPGSVTVYRQCGNGVCDYTESPESCPEDCS